MKVVAVTCRVACAWGVLLLAVEMLWLTLDGTNGIKKCYSHLVTVKPIWALNGCFLAENADLCKFSNEWVWLESHVCSLRLKVHLGSVWSQGSDRNARHTYPKSSQK